MIPMISWDPCISIGIGLVAVLVIIALVERARRDGFYDDDGGAW